MKYFFLILYTFIFKYFPSSTTPIFGEFSKRLRYFCCKKIFKSCGKNVNIERGASFGNGFELEIGDNSGIGRYCHIPPNIKIGKDVMMAPNVFIFHANHNTDRIDIPMRNQGMSLKEPVVIEDDVWIGRGVFIMAGKKVSRGSIIAAGSVVTKNFPQYNIIGGNPAKIIKSRNS